MQLDLQDNYITIDSSFNIDEVIERVNKHILRQECEHMCVDVSALNIMDAVKIGALCSSAHFTKYPQGNLKWIVKNTETHSMMSALSLKTSKITVKRPIVEKKYCDFGSSKVVALR